MPDQIPFTWQQSGTNPADYVVPGAQEMAVQLVRAVFDGTSAAGSFLPGLQILGPGGIELAQFVDTTNPISAGTVVDCTFGPFLRGNIGGGGSSTGTVLWQTFTLAADGVFDIQNIPQTGQDLTLKMNLISATADVDNADMRFNNDAGNHYVYQIVDIHGAAPVGSNHGPTAQFQISDGVAGPLDANATSTAITVQINGYSSTTFTKQTIVDWSVYDGPVGIVRGVWNGQYLSTSAVTRIGISGDNLGAGYGNNLKAGSQVRVYLI